MQRLLEPEREAAAGVEGGARALVHILDDVDVLRVDQVPKLKHVLKDRLAAWRVEGGAVREERRLLDGAPRSVRCPVRG